MTRESYETITGILRGHPRRIRLVCLLNHTLTGFIFVLYPAFLLLLRNGRLTWNRSPERGLLYAGLVGQMLTLTYLIKAVLIL